MKKNHWILLAVGLLIGVLAYTWVTNRGGAAYACADGTEFSVRHAEDFSSIDITPTKNAAIFPERTLPRVESNVGRMYVAGGVVFFGQGEKVQLITTSSSTTCEPVTGSDTPINWGE